MMTIPNIGAAEAAPKDEAGGEGGGDAAEEEANDGFTPEQRRKQ
jgi:hypothetical protein